ncbi:unnamed protein product, partial [Iphiclides podalirius]
MWPYLTVVEWKKETHIWLACDMLTDLAVGALDGCNDLCDARSRNCSRHEKSQQLRGPLRRRNLTVPGTISQCALFYCRVTKLASAHWFVCCDTSGGMLRNM